jgi:predicted MFS family arabinose efflux permease
MPANIARHNKTSGRAHMRDNRVRYEIILVLTLTLAVGLTTFEQATTFYLVPFAKQELGLSNTQIGIMGSGYFVLFALSSLFVSGRSEAHGRPILYLGVLLLLLALGSILSAFVTSFTALFLIRITMGAIAGPILPIAQSVTALESSPARRGMNMGLVGGLSGNILGGLAAPLILVHVASTFGWRPGFGLVLIPALMCAAITYFYLKEPSGLKTPDADKAAGKTGTESRLIQILRYRNIWICIVICCFYAAYISVSFTFLPMFFLQVQGFAAPKMSGVMSMLGLGGIVFSVLLPVMADRIGRRPIMIFGSFLGLALPVGAMTIPDPVWALASMMFIGWAFSGLGSLLIGTIPSETVPARSISTAMGLIVSLGALGGGFVGPSLAGALADRLGLQAPLFLIGACAFIPMILSLALKETRPRGRAAPRRNS